jgi:hypothetical protein
MTIDREMLRTLASDPKHNGESISAALGLGKIHNLYYEINKDADLKTIYSEGRAAAKAQRGGTAKREAAPKPRRRSSSTPPKTNANGKGRITDLLLRKIVHEFEHIKIYEEVSERFDEIAAELQQSL